MAEPDAPPLAGLQHPSPTCGYLFVQEASSEAVAAPVIVTGVKHAR
jgi:hypothetical protein